MDHISMGPVDDHCVITTIKALQSPNRRIRKKGLRQLRELFAHRLSQWIHEELERLYISEYYSGYILTTTLKKVCKNIHLFRHSPAKFEKWLQAFAGNEIRNLNRRLNPGGERPNKSTDGSDKNVANVSLEGHLENCNLEGLPQLANLFPSPDSLSPEEIIEAKICEEYFLLLHQTTLSRLSSIHKVIITRFYLGHDSLKMIAKAEGYAYASVRNQSRKSIQCYFDEFLKLLDEEEQNEPARAEDIVRIRNMINAYGDPDA